MKFPISITRRMQITGFMLWLAMVAMPANAQKSNAPSSADWTQFLGNNLQRWNPNETVIGVNNAGTLQLKWSGPGGSGSSTAVVNGIVYVGGNADNSVHALNASTGATLWTFVTGSHVDSSPAVANGVVYVGSEDNHLYALNATTGALLWSFTAGNVIDSSPTVANGVVYFGSVDNNLYALNAKTGELLWRFAAGNWVYSSPAVANGVVYFGSWDGNIYAVNVKTGDLLWRYSTGLIVSASATVANGVVYISTFEGTLYAFNASTGAVLWSYNVGIMDTTPAIANGVVYAAGDKMYALNAATGKLLWTYNTGFTGLNSPAVANGVVYVGPAANTAEHHLGSDPEPFYLIALNANTGALLWSYDMHALLFSSPVVVNGVVYQAARDKTFAFIPGSPADLFLRIQPSQTVVSQGDLLTYAFPVWNLGPGNANNEVLTTQVPAGTTFDYIRISGLPGLGSCSTPAYGKTGQIVCYENSSMAPNTTWTVRLTVKVTAPAGTVINESGTVTEYSPDPNMANNTATVDVGVH